MNIERALAYIGVATLGAGACFLFIMASDSQADPFDNPGTIDRTIPYEGVLEIDGVEVMSGAHAFDFALFDGPESDGGAAQLWPAAGWASEDLDVRAGRFAVQLGAADGPVPAAGFEELPAEVFEAVDLYLAIRVDDAPLSGRQRINTVPWSVRSAHALHAERATGPLEQRLLDLERQTGAVGEVRQAVLTQAEFQAQMGDCWVLANGDPYALSDWAQLPGFGDTVPDLQGVFLRGYDPGASVDPDGGGRALGSFQDYQATLPGHSHYTAWAGSGSTQGAQAHVTSTGQASGQSGEYKYWLNTTSNTPNFGRTSSASAPRDTRPANVSANFFVRINASCNFP